MKNEESELNKDDYYTYCLRRFGNDQFWQNNEWIRHKTLALWELDQGDVKIRTVGQGIVYAILYTSTCLSLLAVNYFLLKNPDPPSKLKLAICIPLDILLIACFYKIKDFSKLEKPTLEKLLKRNPDFYNQYCPDDQKTYR